MSIDSLLEQVAARGVELWFEGARLRFRAPKGALNAEQRARIVECRDELIAALRQRAAAEHRFAPLSYGQHALWFVHQEEPESGAYHVAFAATVESAVNHDALRHAIQALVDRHETLRTTYEIVDGRPSQRIAGAAPAVVDVVALPGVDDAALRARIERDYQAPFDLRQGVLRATLYSRGPTDHVLLINAHHIAIDGWSLFVLLDEFRALYLEATTGTPVSLPRLQVHYTDYVEWQRQMLAGAEGEKLAHYWQTKLADPRAQIELAPDRPRPARKSVRGATCSFQIDAAVARRLAELARDQGATLFVMLLAAFKILLFRYTGTDDVVIGAPMRGRSKPEFERILGYFVNPVPLRSRLNAEMTVGELTARLRESLMEALDGQEYPLALMVERLQPRRDPSRSPLFETTFAFQHFEQFGELSRLPTGGADSPATDYAGLKVRPYPLHQNEGQFDLGLSLMDRAGGTLDGSLAYNTDLFDATTIQRLIGSFQTLLGSIVATPGEALGRLTILSENERREQMERSRPHAAEHEAAWMLQERFEQQAERRPDAIAVSGSGVSLTYAELNRRANRVAHSLRELGVGPETLVGLCLERTPDLLVGLLGVLKAGGAYLPIDLSYPAERVAFMLEDARSPVLLTQSSLRAQLPSVAGMSILLLDDERVAMQPDGNPPVTSQTGNLVYVIYTSGSTGRPKGVQVEQRNLVAFLEAMRREPGFDERDALLAVTTLSFDIAGLELWLPLIAGGRVVMASRADAVDAERIASMLDSHNVSVMQATPATWRMLIGSGWRGKPDLKVLCGGEAMPRDLAASLVERAAEVWNMYGPTETTIWSTVGRVGDASKPISIGHPIANTQVYVLEPSGQLAPAGVPGELCIGGEGVARGYLNRPELTAEKFVDVRLPDGRSERMYRTGDVARLLQDGQLEFMGRRDHQVKVRGYRIELEEIEAVLARCEEVRQSVVVVRDDTAGNQRLVAYVVASGDPAAMVSRLRAALSGALPEYMVPASFVFLDALPLTPNGKVDRGALPAPEPVVASERKDLDPPATANEKAVAAIWRELLEVPEVGRADNFFELGGHSLIIVTLLERLRRLGLRADVRTVFGHPTLSALAAAVLPVDEAASVDAARPAGIAPGSTKIVPSMLSMVALSQDEIDMIVAAVPGGAANIQDVCPLGPWQEGVLFHHLLQGEEDADTYLIRGVLSFKTKELLDKFVKALQVVVDRHDALRTAVVWDALARPVQVVYRDAALPVAEVSERGGNGPASLDLQRVRIPLSQAPLVRAYVAKASSGGEWELTILLHHIVIDRISLDILMAEIQMILSGRADQLAEPPAYRDVIAQAAGASESEHDEYFRAVLGDVVEPTLPFGLVDLRGQLSDLVDSRRELSPALSKRIRDAALQLGTSPAILFHVAWALVVAHCCGKDDVVFGTVLSGRSRGAAGVDRVMGMFINTLPFRLTMRGMSIVDAVKTTSQQLSELMHHEQASLAQAQRSSKVPAGVPLFNALFNFRRSSTNHNGSMGDAPGNMLRDVRIVVAEQRTNYPIAAMVDDSPQGFAISMQAVAGADPVRLGALLEEAAERLASAVENDATLTVASLVGMLQPIAKLADVPEPAEALLDRLMSLNIDLQLNGDRLKVSAPKGVVSDSIRALISERRDDLFDALTKRAASSVVAGLRPATRERAIPLTAAQQRLWFLDRFEPGQSRHNVTLGLRLRGPLQEEALERAFGMLVERQQSMRTRFEESDGVLKATLLDLERVPFTRLDLSELDALRRLPAALDAVADLKRVPFELSTGPLASFLLIRLAADDYVLAISVHEAVCDRDSLAIAVNELSRLYDHLVAGQPRLPALPIQFADYAVWQQQQLQSEAVAGHLRYWKQQLGGAPALLELPTDRVRPSSQSFRGKTIRFELRPETLQILRGLGERHNASLFTTLLAAWQVLLHRYSGQNDIVVGTPTANRDLPELERLVGCLADHVALRTQVNDNPRFDEHLASVKQTVAGAFDHRAVPFDVLVDSLRPDRTASHAPLFQVLFAVRPPAAMPVAPAGLTMELLAQEASATRFDLSVEVIEDGARASAVYQYATDLFDEQTIVRMHDHFECLLAAFAADATQRIGDVALLTPADKRQMASVWNGTAIAFDRTLTVHALLELSARRAPNGMAVVSEQESLSYRELDQRSNRLAHLLLSRGVKVGSLVAICLDRTVDMVVAMAGVLKAGAAYVPLDPTHPSDRLRFTLQDAGVACAVTSSSFAGLFEDTGAPLVMIDGSAAEMAAQPDTPVAVVVNADDLAYVIYTSGSTGRPKGVQVEHRNVVAFLAAMQREPGFSEHDTLLAVTTLSFDIAGLEVWLPLSVGGRVVLASRTDVLDGERLGSMLESHDITVMQATPATWRLMLDAGWKGKRGLKVLCGGEAMPRDLAAALVAGVSEVWNMYGPTETTIWSTVSRVTDPTKPISIGRAIDNTRVYVLERSGQLAPAGIAGELCIGGEGVARGYLNRAELTAEKFTNVVLPNGRSERVYRTGDVARFRNDGQLEFIGRRDHQVKVRGYRIELEEIEAVLAGLAGVKEGVVTVREDRPGDQRLVGYVVTAPHSDFDVESAKAALRSKLPEYMIPGQFVTLQALPITPNGKIDRNSLPAPRQAVPQAHDGVQPVMSPAQHRVAGIWRDVLRIDRVNLYDNFFDLGGHSLLLVKLQAALKREFQSDLPLVELFQRTTVAAQADRLSTAASSSNAVKRAQARAARQIHD
jgi:amino acid adenylation domain-containing protein